MIGCSVFVRIPKDKISSIKWYKRKFNVEIEEACWLKFKEKDCSFYEFKLKNPSLKQLQYICTYIINNSSIVGVEEINVYFKAESNCLEKLEDRGFSKYEVVDYVDFVHEKKNVKIAVFKDVNHYTLKLLILDNRKEIDIRHFIKLINRVFEIVGKEGLKLTADLNVSEC